MFYIRFISVRSYQAEDRMERCLEDQAKQALRLLNNTSVSSVPASKMSSLDETMYNELLHNASKFYNETIITCDKSTFLKVIN